MATEVQVSERISKLDIQDFVQNATWRELLMELVESKRLDPWDINIAGMLDAYIDIIKRMKVLDLRVPANIILAASILLRMKSESLSVYDEEEQEMAAEEQQPFARPSVAVPELVNRMRLQPGRKITLQELMAELGNAMKTEEKRRHYTEEIQMPLSITVTEDIDSRRDSVLSLLKSNVDRLGMATFSALGQGFQSMEDKVLKLFVPLLFLAQDEIITLSQEELFGEIIVRLIERKESSRSVSTRTR